MTWSRLVAVSVLAALVFAVTGTSASGASSSFCADTAQLQDWIAQDFQPGIDQYDVHPNPELVAGMAQYLQKLSAEAPAQAKDDLTVWAGFTQKVADQASQADLAADVPAARAAASRVKVWMVKGSGCEQLASAAAPSSPGRTSHTLLYWVIGALVVLLILGGLGGSGRARSGGQTAGAPAQRPSAANDLWADRTPQPCLRCNGRRTETCSICHGSGSIPVHDSGLAQFGTSTGACHRCGATGSMTCTGCNGSGTRG